MSEKRRAKTQAKYEKVKVKAKSEAAVEAAKLKQTGPQYDKPEDKK
jgi:hypothetical protein